MQRRAVELLACPACGAGLALDADEFSGDDVAEGRLRCRTCAATFPIRGGIPRFVPAGVGDEAQRTVERFGEQWQEYDFLSAEYEQQFLAWIAPNTADVFRDWVVLDAGCGKGRHSVLISRFGARDVIALDLGAGVVAVRRNALVLDNVHVVQADLFHLPLPPATIDVALSIGVLHHTADPRAAFLALARTLRPGGRVIVWIYGRENNEWIVRYVDPLRNTVTSRLPHRWLYHLARIPAAVLYAASRGVYRPLSRPPFEGLGRRLFYQAYIRSLAALPFRDIHLIVHDHLGPAIASYVPRDEFASWFHDAGLTDVEIGWHNQNSWRGTATMPAGSTATAGRGVEARVTCGPTVPE